MNRFARSLGGITTLAVLGLLVYGLFNLQTIDDWLKLRGYEPPHNVVELANETTMTQEARHAFYVNRPQLTASKVQFQQLCGQREQTIVLGCYHGNQRGIVIFNVSNTELDGVEEVTAAHEMLHATYDRLSRGERQQVDGWLEDYYRQELKDPRILKNIDNYKQTEPNDVLNEMHSIFATEVAQLPQPLENYYQRFFDNRAQVVSFSQQYEAAFTSREERAKALYEQILSLKRQIDTLEVQLTAERRSLEAERDSVDTNEEAAAFNARVSAYNSQVERHRRLVNQYNSLVEEYNQLALQLEELLRSIDSNVTPVN